MSLNSTDLLTTEELAELLRVSELTIWRMRKRGEIPFNRVSGKIRFRRLDVERYLSSNLQNAEAAGYTPKAA